MTNRDADQNLLFGIVALQFNFVAVADLVAAATDWSNDKSKPISAFLVQRGALDRDVCQLIEGLVEKHLAEHGGNVADGVQDLSSVTGTLKALADIADSDWQESLQCFTQATRPHQLASGDTTGFELSELVDDGVRFRVLRPHASGGLGEVFVAEDQQLNREVALKQIRKQHADNPISRARFVLEAEVTGGLEHPGIVPVYGLGHDDHGRPYYAMRFVRGDSLKQAISEFHSARQTSPSDRSGQYQSIAFRKLLGRLIDVCNAIEYAHSRGVLHRDLKPGNIMLGRYGETLVVDWGLSKVRGEHARLDESDESLLPVRSGSGSTDTEMGQALGTPGYMSPEQAAGKLDDLGRQSDVYSLGATLYAILVGNVPFPSNDVHDIIRRVKAGDFPKPSQVRDNVPSALEAICLKAMALQPENRYPSAVGLANDLEAWLADEPTSAWPEPAIVRGRRWVRRHQTMVATTAAVVLISTAGLFAYSLMARQKNQQLTQANQQLDQQKATLATKNSELQAANEETQRAEQDAREKADIASAISDFVRKDILLAASPTQQNNPELTVREAVGLAADNVQERFQDQPIVEAAVRQTLGETYRDLGLYDEAEQQLDIALQLAETEHGRRDARTLSTMHRLASVYYLQSKLPQSEKLMRETWQLKREVLGEDHADTLTALSILGLTIKNQGRFEEALPLYQQTLEAQLRLFGKDDTSTIRSMNNMASLHMELGQYSEAEQFYTEAIEQWIKTAGEDDRDTLHTRRNLARLYDRLGKYPQALEVYQQVLESQRRVLGDEHADLYITMSQLAGTHAAMGDNDKAEELYKAALEGQRREWGADNRQTNATQANLGNMYLRINRLADAEPLLRASVETASRTMGEEHPDALACKNYLGHLLLKQEKVKEAEELYTNLVVAQAKAFGEGHMFTAVSLGNLANTLRQQERYEEAIPKQEESVSRIRKALGDTHPHTLVMITNLAKLYEEMDRHQDAEPLLQEVLQVKQESHGDEHLATREARRDLAAHYLDRNMAAQAEELYRQIIASYPEDAPREKRLAGDWAGVAKCLLEQDELAKAEEALQYCLAIRDENPEQEQAIWVQEVNILQGLVLARQQQYEQAEQLMLPAFELMNARREEIPGEQRKKVLKQNLARIVSLYEQWEKAMEAMVWNQRLEQENGSKEPIALEATN